MLTSAWRHRPTHRRVWALAVPMTLSNLTIPLVAITDTAVVGHLPHVHQLGAVAVGGSLYGALLGALGFLRMGTTGFASQAAGRGDGDALRRILLQALSLGMALALLLLAIGPWLADRALSWMAPSPALTQLAVEYLQTRLLGLPAGLASFGLIGWFLGAQQARGPLTMLLAVNLLNVALDLWFVVGLDWGVAGAARASALAEWSGLALGLALVPGVARRYPGSLTPRGLARWADWRALLAVNRDIFLRSLMLQAAFVLVTVQGSRLGDATVAGNALLLNGLALTAYALDGLAHALEALAGHAIGARNRLALWRAVVVAGGWALLASLVFSSLFGLGGEWLIRLQSDLPEAKAQAQAFLPYLVALPVVAVWSYMLDGLFIAATRARDLRNAMLVALALAIPVGWLSEPLGNHGLWLSFLLFMALRGICLAGRAWQLHRQEHWLG